MLVDNVSVLSKDTYQVLAIKSNEGKSNNPLQCAVVLAEIASFALVCCLCAAHRIYRRVRVT